MATELLLKLGRYDESIQQYEKALAVDPHYVASHYGIAANLIYKGKHDDARKQISALDESLALAPPAGAQWRGGR